MGTPKSDKLLGQTQRNERCRIVFAPDGDDDELLAIHLVGHRRARGARGQLDR